MIWFHESALEVDLAGNIEQFEVTLLHSHIANASTALRNTLSMLPELDQSYPAFQGHM